MQDKKKRQRAPKKWLGAMGIAAGIGFGALALWLFQGAVKQTPARVDTAMLGAKEVKTQVGGEGTPAYNAQVEKSNILEAGAAEDMGKSFVPTIIGSPKKEEPPAPAVSPLRDSGVNLDRSPQNHGPNQSDKESRERIKLLADDMRQMAKESELKAPVTRVYVVKEEKNEGVKASASAAGPDTPPASENVRGLRPGQLLYAINEVALNSDAPGPAMVSVVSGELKGAKAIGKFTRQDEHLVLQFSRLALSDGSEVKLDGYAVDPETSATAVQSSVDNHYLSRWGGLVAASFLEGFGDAVSRSGTTQSSYTGIGTSTTQSYPKYNASDELWIAAGKVGERLGSKAGTNFDRPPTVKLDPGQPLGILVISVN